MRAPMPLQRACSDTDEMLRGFAKLSDKDSMFLQRGGVSFVAEF
jgi:hypothetical protein